MSLVSCSKCVITRTSFFLFLKGLKFLSFLSEAIIVACLLLDAGRTRCAVNAGVCILKFCCLHTTFEAHDVLLLLAQAWLSRRDIVASSMPTRMWYEPPTLVKALCDKAPVALLQLCTL